MICEICNDTGIEPAGPIGTSDIDFPGGVCECQNNPHDERE